MNWFGSLKFATILLTVSMVHLTGCSGSGPDSETLEEAQTQEVPEMEETPDAKP